MIRNLLCRKCGAAARLHREDVSTGFQIRKVYVSAVKPEHHGITVNGVFSPGELVCDNCLEPLAGEVAVAVTMWRGEEPRRWEQEYGTVVPDEAVKVADVLQNTQPRKDI